MKKICLMLALCMVAIFTQTCFAKSGDIKGQYYSTDIVSYLNGREIETINIGGWTLIKAEDMQYFGFYVTYDDATRKLTIEQSVVPVDESYTVSDRIKHAPGKVLGNYYETDIKTYLDGHLITAFNTNGITYILAEEMAEYGYDVVWDSVARTLSVQSPKQAGYQYSIPISRSEFKAEGNWYDASQGNFAILWNDKTVQLENDAVLFDSDLSYDGMTYTFELRFYQNQGLFYSESLMSRLDSLASVIFDEQQKSPEELYDEINGCVAIKINGVMANHVKISKFGGNGHRDYYFEIDGLPKFKEGEIKEIEFLFLGI